MTREEAIKRLAETPQYIPARCSWCKARTVSDASTKCQPQQLPCGDYYCGTPEEAPDTGGKLHQLNPEYARLDGYLWGWYAYDEGMTDKEPEWEDGK
ncbi:MAG: hypothetical protein CL583_13490 [Alteromonadaceae bacterium]|nr:hypothetical protein [Alteromonadaceae bacterium]